MNRKGGMKVFEPTLREMQEGIIDVVSIKIVAGLYEDTLDLVAIDKANKQHRIANSTSRNRLNAYKEWLEESRNENL